MKWIKENKTMAGVIALLIVIVVVAGIEFLSRKDPGGISGWEAIGQLGGGFWLWVLLAGAVSGVGVYFLVKRLNQTGGVGVSLSVLVAILLPLMIVFGKGCEAKSDGGVNTRKGRPDKVEADPNRVPAEDLLPKK